MLSKIFDAYRMRVGEAGDVSEEIQRAGNISLFAPPHGRQQSDFNQLAQRTLGLRTESRGAILCLASSTRGEGASFVSYTLAVSLAQVYKQKVAWIDANFHSPQQALEGPGRTSFGTLLQDPQLVRSIPIDANPFLVPGGENLMASRGAVASANYRRVLDEMAQRFDFVILDLPPILDSSETGIMALGGDGLLLVIEQKFLKWEIVEHGVQKLRDKGVNVLGTVINRREFALPKVIYDRL